MASFSSVNSKIILITGNPGVGKTTLIKKLFDKLNQESKFKNSLIGFYTEEVREEKGNGERIGFDVIDLHDQSKRATLARTASEQNTFQSKSAPKVGKYSVDLKSFESIALPILKETSIENRIFLIDEIGKMEMFSSSFQSSINQILLKLSDDKNIILIATVPNKPLAFSDKLKSNPLSKLFTVTFQNRNTILNEIYDQVLVSFK